MSVKKPYTLLLTLILALLLFVPAGAASTTAPVQAYIWEQNLDVFLSGSLESENLSCTISNQKAEITGSGTLADMGVTIRTVLLVDVSGSIPSGTRPAVLSVISTLIENIGQTEQYKIVTFGEKLTVLQDFTSDRYDLARAAEKIKFTDKLSTIYDAVYQTIPTIQPVDGNPCYYRTVIITDGVDVSNTGVTVEELYLKLQGSTYPIDVIAVSKDTPVGQNQELGALTRISGGQYYTLTANTDPAALAGSLGRNDLYWVRAVVPGSLLDGVVRQVDITDGTRTVQFDSKFPVYSGAAVETLPPQETSNVEPTEDPAQSTETPGVEPTAAPVPSLPGTESFPPFGADGDGSDLTVPILLGVAAVILVVVLVVVLVAVGKKGKGKTNPPQAMIPPSRIAPTGPGMEGSKPTVVLPGAGGDICIRLHNAQMPNEGWEFSLQQEILVGRSPECQLRLAEESVSRVQCKIYKRGDVMVENLSRANLTKLNNQVLTAPAVLHRGDTLTCGRVTLVVDSVHVAGPQGAGNLNKVTGFINI